jgi:hypothetical protein
VIIVRKYSKNYLVCGIGKNDASYNVSIYKKIEDKVISIFECPFYAKWVNMIERCYSKRRLKMFPSYAGCTVCEEWLTFSNFKAWMENQDWQGKELDKDILVYGNTIYSPDSCACVSRRLNLLCSDRSRSKRKLLQGCRFCKVTGKYQSQCFDMKRNKQVSIGYFNTQEESHKAWKAKKLESAMILVEKESDQRLKQALIRRYS